MILPERKKITEVCLETPFSKREQKPVSRFTWKFSLLFPV